METTETSQRKMTHMKTTYIFLACITILMYNGLLIQRDTKLFDAYDKEFAKIKYDHPTLNEMNK
jgi:hypothetical protein